MDKIISILENVHPDVDYRTEKGLVTRRVLNSLEVLMIMTELCDAFDIESPAAESTPEHFDSAEAIFRMVQDIQEEE